MPPLPDPKAVIDAVAAFSRDYETVCENASDFSRTEGKSSYHLAHRQVQLLLDAHRELTGRPLDVSDVTFAEIDAEAEGWNTYTEDVFVCGVWVGLLSADDFEDGTEWTGDNRPGDPGNQPGDDGYTFYPAHLVCQEWEAPMLDANHGVGSGLETAHRSVAAEVVARLTRGPQPFIGIHGRPPGYRQPRLPADWPAHLHRPVAA